jgi:hypothetical protein
MNIFIILICIIIIFLYFYININTKLYKRKTYIYNLAKKCAYIKNKQLMVIGDPANGDIYNRNVVYPIVGYPYGYGDLCIDLSGCPENPNNSIKSKLEDIIGTFEDNSYVIYISQTLEYINPNVFNYVINELKRVSGNDLFIVNMDYDSNSYTDRYNTFDRHTYITKAPPNYNFIEYYHFNNKNKIFTINLN